MDERTKLAARIYSGIAAEVIYDAKHKHPSYLISREQLYHCFKAADFFFEEVQAAKDAAAPCDHVWIERNNGEYFCAKCVAPKVVHTPCQHRWGTRENRLGFYCMRCGDFKRDMFDAYKEQEPPKPKRDAGRVFYIIEGDITVGTQVIDKHYSVVENPTIEGMKLFKRMGSKVIRCREILPTEAGGEA